MTSNELFPLTDEHEMIRQVAREFAQNEIAPIAAEFDETGEFPIETIEKMGAQGFMGIAVPEEYGGAGVDALAYVLALEEISKADASHGTIMSVCNSLFCCGILHYGTEEQKEKYVGGIGRGELVFCLGYSEPEAGSDLAAVQTLAVEDGDHYILNGQKIFTSLAHRADYCWLAARTDRDAPKHKGISMFIIDMKTPGITVKPLINMLGFHEFNEVFLDNVRVPKENMVGEKNRGWYTLIAALNFERSVVYIPAANRRIIEDLVSYARETPWDGGVLADNPIVRHKLADMAVCNEVCRLLCYRVVWMQSRGMIPAYETSASYLHTAELTRRLGHTGMEILGLYGQLDKLSKWTPLKGAIKSLCLGSLGLGIGGGTNEIQRNLIATIGLGLPRA